MPGQSKFRKCYYMRAASRGRDFRREHGRAHVCTLCNLDGTHEQGDDDDGGGEYDGN